MNAVFNRRAGVVLLALALVLVCGFLPATAEGKTKKKKPPLAQAVEQDAQERDLQENPTDEPYHDAGDKEPADEDAKISEDTDSTEDAETPADGDVETEAEPSADELTPAQIREKEIAEKSAEIERNFQERTSFLCPVCGSSDSSMGTCSQCETPLVDTSDSAPIVGE
jgi:cytoskeletal protein RodZ